MVSLAELSQFISSATIVEQRTEARDNLSEAGKKQKEIRGGIVTGLMQSNLTDDIIHSYNPSQLPLVLGSFYPLEIAIKFGDITSVEKIFACYERTMSKNYVEEMTVCTYMEVPYRPIFWLAAVCDSDKVVSFDKDVVKPETYYRIMKFMETKLGIDQNHKHPTPIGLFSRVDYIVRFCANKKKQEFFLAKLKEISELKNDNS